MSNFILISVNSRSNSYIAGTGAWGEIPTTISQATKLRMIALPDNLLEGPLPSLVNLTNLKILYETLETFLFSLGLTVNLSPTETFTVISSLALFQVI